MDKKRSISIKEIAKLANVSVATVSRVINNNGRFSEETRKKVQDIIDKYGYTTNMAAKSLRMSKSKTVGLIVPNIDNEWFSHLVLEIEKYFFEKNSKTVKLNSLIENTQYGYNASALQSGKNKFLRISDITDGKVEWDTVPYCDCNDEETYLLYSDDILIARTGGTGKSSERCPLVPV